MLTKLLQMLGMSCRHSHISHPFAAAVITRNKSDDWDTVTESGDHYVVCLDCGRKFRYDWSAMRVVT